ncbi:MAG TPA: ABC transporter ATP-binding protein [Candidatus Acidoferrum sp.]|nr:ABC transporter ATP-binding protein [Candidatus Acidoferrum sp.]
MNFPISADNISKTFGRKPVLAGLTLEVPENGIYGLIGPNGAGKTTAIKIVMNILRPTSGRAYVLGTNSMHLSPKDLACIGYVAADQQLPGWMTLEMLLAYLKPFYPTWDDSYAAELVRDFDLPLTRKIANLSHGMRMKTALACSLAYRPRVLLLDEPFTGLDPLVRDELIGGILASGEHATILISSHDLNDIETFVSHVGYLDKGRLRFSEEMSVVTSRFREVQVLIDGATPAPGSWPAAWLNIEQSDHMVRYVDTNFDRQRTLADIRRIFGDATRVETKAMPLRSIFVTLAKSARREA